MILMWAMLLAMGTMAFAPDLPVSRFLRRLMIERPSAWLAGASLGRAALALLGLAAVIVLVAAAPEALLLTGALGDAALLEVLIAVWLASMAGGLTGAWRRIVRLVSLAARIAGTAFAALRRARPRRRRTLNEPKPTADEVDGPGRPALAWA